MEVKLENLIESWSKLDDANCNLVFFYNMTNNEFSSIEFSLINL